MFSERPIQPNNPDHLDGVVQEINSSLTSLDFNEEDRAEVEANRRYFQQRADRLRAVAGRSIKSSELAV